MAEDKYTEYKESWRDEYLHQICGLANTNGGSLFVGIDDKGKVVGVSNCKKLQEDIPNKVRDTLGIVPDVVCHVEDGKEYLEVIVPANVTPVSYKNKFYYRSGSVTSELVDTQLHSFLLEKMGGRWDSIPVGDVSIDDLDGESFSIFRRRAIRSGRMTEEDVKVTNAELLDKLNLITPDGKLKKAAILLFHPRPEKWAAGAFTKIGRFTRWEDLRYHDEAHGSLLWQAELVLDLIFTKYLIANISYDGVMRIETFPYPLEAIREAFYNALMHNAYESDTPLQIRIDYDAMYISNDLRFNSQLTAEKLMHSHKSQPSNPTIANTFYRAGFVEAWGRGVRKMCVACEKIGCKQPEYIVDATSIMLCFRPLFIQDDLPTENNGTANGTANGTVNGTVNDTVNGTANGVLRCIKENPTANYEVLSMLLNIKRRTLARHINQLKEQNLIERSGSSKTGLWVITEKGLQALQCGRENTSRKEAGNDDEE